MSEHHQHQPKLHYDDLDDALSDLVLVLGGYKKVGPMLWPNIPQQDAANRLRHSLNKSRREKLDHHETVQLLHWARAANFHGAKHFIDEQTGYHHAEPLDPADARVKAIEAVQLASAELRRAVETLERAEVSVRAGGTLKAVG